MARTVAQDPLQKYKFRVTIPGLPSGMGFQKMGQLKRDIGVVEYDEGGYSHTHKLTGKEKVEAITLEKGMFVSTDLETLYKKTLNSPDFRTAVTIDLMDKFGKVARSWTLSECWCSTWEGTDFDASSEDVAIEKITLQFEHFLD